MRVDLDFTEQEPIPAAAVERVEALLASGKLFRYGEHGADEADAALLEADFASLVSRRSRVALNSRGASLAVMLWKGPLSACCRAIVPSAEPPIPSTQTFSKRPFTPSA